MGVMPDSEPGPGLRERKKIRTRETLRREALRLIAEQGFAATTIEQIAAASEVSPARSSATSPTSPRCWCPTS